uniref:Histone deacetylase complex subunit n=1 Tax=Anoplophora glabripennis TaxID=217634 RepID=V5GNA3_ANOGL
MRFNPVMVVEPNRSQQFTHHAAEAAQEQQPQTQPKVTSSPRPSILRKRDHDGSPLKAAKSLAPALNATPVQSQAPVSPPSRPDSNGHSSGGSTTISATSSPGLAEVNDDSNPHAPMNNKEEEEVKPPVEMSPRKKPRKQQLTGNDLDEHNDDMQFISENTVKKEEDSEGNHSDEPRDGAPEAGQITTVRKPASASLLNSYRHNWKANHNHYLRHSDVRPKDERRPTIMDLANQHKVQEKVNGWKIFHLSTQMEDLAEQEERVYNQLTELLKCTESEERCKQFDKEVNSINELIKGNLQRIKIINDGMIHAKAQVMKMFDHKVHVMDIINRCASKRNFKKREKS